MSEQQNAALVEKLYAAFGQGNIQTILDNLTEDVEWTLEGPPIIPFAGQRRGRQQVADFFAAIVTTQINIGLATHKIIAQGDTVATVGRYTATVKATGKRMDTAIAHFFTIQNGKVTHFLDLADTAAMAEAYITASAAAR